MNTLTYESTDDGRTDDMSRKIVGKTGYTAHGSHTENGTAGEHRTVDLRKLDTQYVTWKCT